MLTSAAIIAIMSMHPGCYVSELEIVPHHEIGYGEYLPKEDRMIISADTPIPEFVIAHECWHVIDEKIKGNIKSRTVYSDRYSSVYLGDPSIVFYAFSWENVSNRRKNSTHKDFVSEYAMTSPFEDAAETYAYMKLHPRELKKKMRRSVTLQKKVKAIEYMIQLSHNLPNG